MNWGKEVLATSQNKEKLGIIIRLGLLGEAIHKVYIYQVKVKMYSIAKKTVQHFSGQNSTMILLIIAWG